MHFVTRKAHFNAAHRLHNPSKSDEWNEQTYGKCNYPNWHGHNYEIEVTMAGEPDPETGYVVDLGALKQIIDTHVLEPCDHRNLNLDVPFLKDILPSAENLARVFFEQLQGPAEAIASPNVKLYSVVVYETERNRAEYCPYKVSKL